MSENAQDVYFAYFDPVTSRLPIPSDGIDGDCDRVILSIPREWAVPLEAVLRRLEFVDAWDGDEVQAEWAVGQVSLLIERLYEGEFTYADLC